MSTQLTSVATDIVCMPVRIVAKRPMASTATCSHAPTRSARCQQCKGGLAVFAVRLIRRCPPPAGVDGHAALRACAQQQLAGFARRQRHGEHRVAMRDRPRAWAASSFAPGSRRTPRCGRSSTRGGVPASTTSTGTADADPPSKASHSISTAMRETQVSPAAAAPAASAARRRSQLVAASASSGRAYQ